MFGPVLTPIEPTLKDLTPHRVSPTDPLALRAREIEIALKDAATDLGLAIDLTGQIPGDGAKEIEIVKRAASGVWVVSPRLEQTGSNSYTLRMVAVQPGSSTILTRIEKTDGQHLAARAVVMLRDLVSTKLGTPETAPCNDEVVLRGDERERSRGRPLLAASTSLFGLYGAFSIYRSAGNEDPRLLYPLLALGSGIGLGASLLASEEFNVTPASAWTIAGGTWWGVISGLNIAVGRDVQPVEDRYSFGLGGGLLGTTLAITALAATRFDDGDAALVHSGAALGTFTGGAISYLVHGDLKENAATGLGLGAGIGLIGGGFLAAGLTTTAQRVLLIDLGAGLGALGGASAASYLVVKDNTPEKTRLFVSAALGGAVLGGAVAWLTTRDKSPEEPKKGASRVMPLAGILGHSVDPRTGATFPIYGGGLSGAF